MTMEEFAALLDEARSRRRFCWGCSDYKRQNGTCHCTDREIERRFYEALEVADEVGIGGPPAMDEVAADRELERRRARAEEMAQARRDLERG